MDSCGAWCGNPAQSLPHSFLKEFNGKLRIILGTSFYHTHPDAIVWFKKNSDHFKVYNDKHSLFHPKLYLFINRNKFSLFIGSSNLTDGGFSGNIEANLLVQGNIKDSLVFSSLQNQFKEWDEDDYSFTPTKEWIKKSEKNITCVKRKKEMLVFIRLVKKKKNLEVQVG